MSFWMLIIFIICTHITNPKTTLIRLTCSTNRITIFNFVFTTVTIFSIVFWWHSSQRSCHWLTINPITMQKIFFMFRWTLGTKISWNILRWCHLYLIKFYSAEWASHLPIIIVLLHFLNCLHTLIFIFFLLPSRINFFHKNTVQQHSHRVVPWYLLSSWTLRAVIVIGTITFKTFVLFTVFKSQSRWATFRLAVLTFSKVDGSGNFT